MYVEVLTGKIQGVKEEEAVEEDDDVVGRRIKKMKDGGSNSVLRSMRLLVIYNASPHKTYQWK
jgi:hypothetical protein